MNLLEPSTTIEHWLQRQRAGDPAARNELLRHSRERLRLLTRQMFRGFRHVHQFEETSDVVQNVLLRLDRALSAVDVPSSRDFFRLAASHIRHALLDLARRYSRQAPPGPGGEEAPDPPGPGREDDPQQ